MSHRTHAVLISVVASVALAAATPARAGTCEEDVVAECVATTCPTFCATLDAGAVDGCKATCTADDRCKLTLFGGQDRSDQPELDIQNRQQLMSCLAENRDPITVPDDLGKPILTEGDGAATADDASTADGASTAKRGSLKDKKVAKKGWKKVQCTSFARRKKGKPRIDPRTVDDQVAPETTATKAPDTTTQKAPETTTTKAPDTTTQPPRPTKPKRHPRAPKETFAP